MFAASTRILSRSRSAAVFSANIRKSFGADAHTAGAVRVVMERHQPGEAAIASEAAANIYGGVILATNVEDDPQNFTRFFRLGSRVRPFARSTEPPCNAGKRRSFSRSPTHPALLYRALGVFATAGIDLSKIESRPIPGKPRDYAFDLGASPICRTPRSRKPSNNCAQRPIQ